MSVSYIDVSSLSSTAGKKMSHKTVERATTKKVAPSKSNQSDDGYVTMRRIVRSTRQAPTTSSLQAHNGDERNDDDDDYSSDDFDSDDDSPDETQVRAPDYDVIDSCVPANICILCMCHAEPIVWVRVMIGLVSWNQPKKTTNSCSAHNTISRMFCSISPARANMYSAHKCAQL